MRRNYWLDLQKHYDLEVRKNQQEILIKQRLMAKKNNPRYSPEQRENINNVLIQGSLTNSVKWVSVCKSWESRKWSRVN